MAKLDNNPALAVHLEENRPFVYAHLLKFERPLKEWTDPNATVLYSEKYSRYMHITDASYSINFDDGSEYYSGQSLLSNGAQTYFPNKLISVSSVQDSAESKVANFNITLAADALDASLYSQTLTFSQVSSDYFIEAVDSFSAAGFTEGDVIYLNSSTGVHKFKKFVIAAFLNEGKKLRVLEETYSFTEDTWAETGNTYDITSSSTEITALTLNQQSANFVNRQVSIFKAFFYEDEPDVFIGSPVLLFSGIITSANYKEDPEKRATISWTCKSHWGDFQQVRGRVGSDDFHRALNSSGKPQPSATIRPEYAQDLGFQHANNAVNIIGLYTTTETEYKQVWRNKLLGTKKLKEIEVEVENEVDLRFNLSAKYIPLVYGVRRIEGTPFFADTNLDASKLYLAEVLSEGPIQSILNIYVEDQPLICISEQDSAVRSSGSDSVDVVCYGRADRGQVLLGTSSVSTNFTTSSGYSLNGGSTYEEDTSRAIDEAVAAGSAVTTGGTHVKLGSAWYVPSPVTTTEEGQKGITHQTGIRLSSPGSIDIDFKSGLADQTASSSFATIANNTGFKLQSDYFGLNSAAQYWGGEHRVLDTAYTTSEFAISAEQTTAPSIDYVIKGKLVESFNYDGSFGHIGSLESEDNFSLGDTVSIKTIAGVALASNVTVIDKWYYFDGQGNQNYRFRWDLTALQEQSLLNAKAFYMEKGSDTWTMSTYDYKEGNVFQVEKTLEEEVISVSSTPSQDLQVQTNLANLSASDLGTDSAVQAAIKIDAPARELDGVSSGIPAQIKASISDTTTATESTGAITLPGVATNDFDAVVSSTEVSTFIVVLNKIKLSANANLSNVIDYYKGKEVSITKVDSNGNKIEITRPITAYDPTNRILTISPDFVLSEVPESTDTVVILGTPEGQDIRPTNNFALMLLDYLRSKRYGAGLRLDSKLNKDSFLQSARTCDTRSDITLTATNPGGLAPGDVYTYAPNSVFKWRGTIKAVTISGSNATIVFGDCIGKLTHKFSKINSREINDIVWDEGGSQTSLITSAGLQTIITSNASSITTFSLSGPSTLTVAAPAGANPVSYSLYDSDFITYWKYIGWDSPDQRWVTRHQGNITIDTSQPVFNVIGSLLDHFNGILSFEDGKFALSVETKKDSDKDLFWNFLSSPEGWSVTGGTLTSLEEYATISGAGVELEKAGLSFIGNENAVIKARIRRLNIGSWQGRVYYSTDTHGFSNSYYKDINVPTGFGSLNEWSIASWDMSDLTVGGNDYTNNFITGLAFDLGVNFDIEWISVGSSLRVIEQEDIVGSLTIKDEGLSKSYNSLSASIVDPANNFNTRSVSFFNSEYLKQDRGVVRSGSYQLEGITNYYNARLAVEQTLNRSRFSRQVSFTLRPVGLALSPGDIIRVKYPRFGWDTGKYFRIQSLTYQTNCMVSIVATEHDDSIYFIDAPKVSPYSVTRDFQALVKVPDAPSNLEATNDGTLGSPVVPSTEILEGIRLTWDKAASENERSRAYYEIHRSVNSDFTGAVKIATIPHNSSPTYLDILQPTTRTSYYYKIRTANEVRIQTTNLRETKVYYSDFFPGTAVEGTTQAKFNIATTNLYQRNNSNSVAPTVPSNVPITYTFSTANLSSSPNNGWTNTIPSSGGPYLWQISQVVQSITDTVEINPWNSPSLLATDGSSNIFIDLDNENATVTADEGGNAGTLSISSTATVYLGTGVDSGWTFSVTADSGITGALVGSTYTVTALSSGFSSGDVLFEATKAGFPTLYKDFSISKVNTGQAGRVYAIITDATAIGYNPNSNTFTTTSFTAQAILTTGNGTPSNYSGIFKIYLDGNTTATYTSSSAETSTTFSSYTSSNSSIFIELYDNTGSTLLDAETVPIVKDGSSSPTVTITSSSYTVAYDATGSNPSPSSITFTATAAGGISDPYFKFTGNNITDETSFTDGTGDTDTFIYTPPASYFGTPHSIRVGVSDGDQVELSFDTLTISALQPGSQGESGAELRLYQAIGGGDTIPSAPTGVSFNFSTGALSNIPSGWSETPTSTGYVQIEYVATAFVQGLGTISNITFNAPVASFGGNPFQNYIFRRSPNKPTKPTNTVNFAIPANWYDDINNVPAGTDPMWSSVGNSTATFSTTLVWTTAWGEPNQIEGRDGATIILTNEAHVLPTNSSGTVDYTDSGTSIQVYLGTQPVPFDGSSPYSSPSFRVSAAVTQGTITIGTISGSSNTVTVGNHTNQTTDLAIITYTITVVNSKGDSETYTKTQSISKSKEGQEGIKNETFEIYYSLSSSSAPTTPSATSYTFSSGSFTGLTSSWTTTPVPITGAAANNFWKSRVIARENSNAAGVSSGANLSFSSAVRLLSGFGDVVGKNETQINIDNLVDSNNVRTYASYAGLGLNSSGYITGGIWDGSTLFSSSEALNVRGAFSNVATTPNLDVAYGGTGEVNSNTFRNDNITVSQGASGVFTLSRGAYAADTTTITKSNLGLNYAEGATVGATWGTNLASQPADNTIFNNNLTVSQGASGVFTLSRGAYAANTTTITKSNLGLNYAEGATVGATWGSNLASQPADNTIFNNNLTVSQGASGVFTLSRGAYAADTTTITKSNLGLNYAEGATVGATWGSNLASQPADNTIFNNNLTVSQGAAGVFTLSRGAYAADTTTISKSNLGLNYAEGATVGATWGTNISSQPSNLAGINSTEGTKLGGIASGATVGATWGSNLASQPADNTIFNNNLTVSQGAAGVFTLSRGAYAADTTTISKSNLGLNYAEGATVGATWGTNISSQPSNLAGINSTEGTKLGGIASGATVGATWGSNLVSQPADNTIFNNNLTVSQGAAGVFTLSRGAYAADTTTISKSNLGLNYAEGATVGATWGTNISSQPSNLAGINSTEGTKLGGIASGATVGATWGSNLASQPADNTIFNNNLTVSQGAAGVFTLSRGAYAADTTTISKSNLGLNYAEGATVGATWGTNISSQPSNLAGINSTEGTKLGGIASGATVGATWGSNLASQPADNTIFNNNLTVSQGAAGVFTLSRGAYAADTTTISKSNLGLNYAEGATVGATWGTNISSQPSNLAGINSTEGTKLGGIASGATVGATWGTNISSQPSNLAGINSTEGTKLGGIASGATVGATWGTNISSQPSNLAGINSTEGTKLGGIASGATVGATWGTNISSQPSNLAGINSTEGTKLGGIASGATVGAVWDTNITSQPATSTILNSGITTVQTSGSTTHSWSITNDGSTTSYNPQLSSQQTIFEWYNGAGTKIADKTITTTLQTSTKDGDVAYGGTSAVTMSPSSAPQGITGQTITATYNGVKASVSIFVIDMSGWTFKAG